jgi:hypothetical protein
VSPEDFHGAGTEARQRILLAVLATTAAGLLLRLLAIGVVSFWSDEVFSVFWVRNDLAFLWTTGLEIETNPPLYYTLLKGWVAIFGDSEAGARSLSAVLSAAAIPVVFLLGRELAGGRAGLLAAILFAVTPVQIHYAQEARAYALLVLLAAATMLSLVRLVRLARLHRPLAGALALYVASASLLLYAHATAPFILGALGLAALFCLARPGEWRQALPRFLLANAVVALAAAPQFGAMLTQMGRADVAWIPAPSLPGLITLVDVLLVDPFTPQASFRLASVLAAALGLSLAAALALALARKPRAGDRLAGFLIIAPASFVAASILVSLKVPFLIPRVAIWLSVPLCVLLAILFLAPAPRLPRAAVGIALVAAWSVGLHGVYARAADFTEDWRGLSASLAARVSPADLVVVGPGTIPTGIALYADPIRARWRWHPDGMPERRNRFLPDGVPAPLSLTTARLAEEVQAGGRVWLVLNENDWRAHAREALAAVPGVMPAVDDRHPMLALVAW